MFNLLAKLAHPAEKHVKFKSSDVTVDEKPKSLEELKGLATDAQTETLKLELKAHPLADEDIQNLARTVVHEHQPETYKLLQRMYPGVLTQTFTDQTLHAFTPGNEFLIPLQASKCPATMFNAGDTVGIKKFEEEHRPFDPFAVVSNDWFAPSQFRPVRPKHS